MCTAVWGHGRVVHREVLEAFLGLHRLHRAAVERRSVADWAWSCGQKLTKAQQNPIEFDRAIIRFPPLIVHRSSLESGRLSRRLHPQPALLGIRGAAAPLVLLCGYDLDTCCRQTKTHEDTVPVQVPGRPVQHQLHRRRAAGDLRCDPCRARVQSGRVRRKGSAGVARFFPTRLPNPNSISYRLPGVGRHCADNRGGIKGDAWASAGFSGHSDSEPRFRDNHLPQVGRVTAPPDAPQPMPCRTTGFPPGDAACGGRGPRFLDEPCAC